MLVTRWSNYPGWDNLKPALLRYGAGESRRAGVSMNRAAAAAAAAAAAGRM